MRVDEPRQQGGAPEGHDLGARAAQRGRHVVAPDRDDDAVAHRDNRGSGHGVVHRAHDGVDEQQIGSVGHGPSPSGA